MKKLYALLLLVSASLFAQPVINQPSPIFVCDQGSNGLEVIDLTVRNEEILGNLNPDDHSLSFHLSQADAENFENLLNPFNYTMNGNLVVFVRVHHIDTPALASIVPLEVVWQQTIEGTVFGGGTFCENQDLIVTFSATGGVAPYTFTYNIDGGAPQTIVSTGANQAMFSIVGTAIGTFVVNLESVSDAIGNDCSIVVTEGAVFNIVSGPTATLSGGGIYCLNSPNPALTFTGSGGTAPYTFTYALNGAANQTVTTSSGDSVTLSVPTNLEGSYTYQLFEVSSNGCTSAVAGEQVFTIISGAEATVSGGGEYCQFSEAGLTLSFAGGQAPYSVDLGLNGVFMGTYSSNLPNLFIPINTDISGTFVYSVYNVTSNGCTQQGGDEQLVVVNGSPAPFQAPDMVVEDSAPFDGIALFEFFPQVQAYTQGNPDVMVSFHMGEAEAMAGVNEVLSPYFNMTNPQEIWARVQSESSGCFFVDPFNLIVTPPGTDAIFIPDTNLKAALVAANPSVNTAMNAQNQNITVDTNGDGEIQISEANQVVTLQVNALGITSMEGIKFFYNLESLYCHDNVITSLDISGMPWLVFATSMNNQTMQSLDVTGNTMLETLYVQNCALTSLNVLTCTNLAILGCFQNDLTSLNVQGLENLQMLNCDFNQLTTLNVAGLTSLTDLSCNFNQIASLDVSSLAGLTALSASSNLLTTIDVSENHNLNLLNVEANLLETVFMKNGSNEEFLFGGNDNLVYICADLSQIEVIEASINFNENILVTPYCTDEPGGNHNTIYGTVRFDSNGNGCDSQDLAQPFTKVRITDGGSEGFVFLNSDLEYIFHTGAGNFEVSPDLENSTLFNVTPAVASVSFADVENNVSINNFCLTANGTSHDVEVVLAPLGVARPGFDSYYQLLVRNKGNQVESGTVTFNFNDALTDFVSSVPGPSSQAIGIIGYNYSNLDPFEIRVMNIMLNVNAPTETPAVNIGDVLAFSVQATLSGTDILPQDNTMNFNQTVVGAYDPNDKQCVEGDVVSPTEIGKYLHYVINFENTGNFPAENVMIRDVIDLTKFDLSSLQVLSASHAVTARVTGNIGEFFFKNINLGIGGHGNILLKIKTLETLVEGDIATNKADIFFDYNYPIETNTASTAFQELSAPGFDLAGFSVYPNPSNGLFTINAAQEIQALELYDLAGRLLQVSRPDKTSAQIDLTQRQGGLYLLKVRTSMSTATLKLLNR